MGVVTHDIMTDETYNFDESDDKLSNKRGGVFWSSGVKEVQHYLHDILQTVSTGTVSPGCGRP